MMGASGTAPAPALPAQPRVVPELSLVATLEWLYDAARVWPELPSFPEGLVDALPVELAEARSRLSELGLVCSALRRVVDEALAERLGPYGAVRLGDSLLRPSGSKGKARVTDPARFWGLVTLALSKTDDPAGLLGALFSPDDVHLTGLGRLAAVLGVSEPAVRGTVGISYDSPSGALSSTGRARWPVWAQKMADGEARITAAYFPEVPDEEPPPEEET